jgi:hypothetical protein
MNTPLLQTKQWQSPLPDRPCDQHIQSTRRMSLTVKRPSTKGSTFQLFCLRCDRSDDSGSALLRPRLAASGLNLISGPAVTRQFSSALFRPRLEIPESSFARNLRSRTCVHMISLLAHAHCTMTQPSKFRLILNTAAWPSRVQ